MSDPRALPTSQSVSSIPAARKAPADAEMVDVAIVVAVRMYREWLTSAIEAQTDITVVGAAGELSELTRDSVSAPPTVAVVELGEAADLGELEELLQRFPEARIVALICADDGWDLPAFAALNIAGYLTREQSADELIAAVRAVARGDFVCSPRITFALLQQVAAAQPEPPSNVAPQSRLTSREHEIAAWIEQGASNKEIARELCIELATVKNHVHNILFKLELRRRGEVAAWVRAGQQANAEI